VALETQHIFASYSKTKHEYNDIFRKTKYNNLKHKNKMKATVRINSLQQPAGFGGLRRDLGGVAIEGMDPSFLGCAVSQRHR
jgi:hypothetical protein